MPIQPVTHTRLHLPGMAPSATRPLRMVARDLAASESLAPHVHPWGQITYALEGSVRVNVGNNMWIVPPLRAIWIPPDIVHEVTTLESARMRALYVLADVAPFNGTQCVVLDVSPLWRELIVALTQADENSYREQLYPH